MKQNLLEELLDGRSPEFKETVRALVQRHDIDESDPTFILLAGTATLEAVLIQFPQQFESLFISLLAQMNQRWESVQHEIVAVTDTASQRLAADWQQLSDRLNRSALDTVDTADQIDSRLLAVKQLLDERVSRLEEVMLAERAEFKQFVADGQETIRVQAKTQVDLLKTVFEGQSQELEVLAEKFAAQATATAQANVKKQLAEINQGLMRKHYIEAAGFACFCAALLMGTSWTAAWVSRGRAEDNTRWADIERWNTDDLQACDDAKLTTCNFHIQVPDD